MNTAKAEAWSGGTRRFFWRRVLWSLVYPQRGQQIRPTLPGVLLIGVSLGIGMAAYNSANNILFITLSLLLSCLILSGVLSWLNFRRVAWAVRLTGPWRAGQDHAVTLALRNEKTFLPSYGLWFDLKATVAGQAARLGLPARLDPEGEAALDWIVRPAKRGRERVVLEGVGSMFPFGFLRKTMVCETAAEVVVWPARVEYRLARVGTPRQPRGGRAVARRGQSGDLLALRTYTPGDSHRLIHWKASARLRRLMVRQFSAEQQEGVSLRLSTTAEIWTRPEQFELLCGFVATLVEDFFKAGRLAEVSIDDRAPVGIRRAADLDAVLDQLAEIEPAKGTAAWRERRTGGRAGQVLTFAPDGARGVMALIDGEVAATA